jgi:hypothetical protein
MGNRTTIASRNCRVAWKTLPQQELFQAMTACLLATKRGSCVEKLRQRQVTSERAGSEQHRVFPFFKEDIMNGLRLWAPSFSAFVGHSSVIWGLIDSSVRTAERVGVAFLGVPSLLLAFVSARALLPREQ